MRTRRSAVFVSLAAALLAVPFLRAPSALAGDLIQKKDGTFQPALQSGNVPVAADYDASGVQVLNADSEEISYEITTSGKVYVQKAKAAEVLDIWLEPKDYPSLWREAVAQMENGESAKAAQNFKAIGDEKRVHPFVRQKAYLYAARALAQTNPAAAAAAYDALLKAFPKSFFTAAVKKDLSQMWMDAGDEPKARAAAEELLKLPGVSESDRIESRFLLVTIDFRKAVTAKDAPGIQRALDEYRKLSVETQGKPDLAAVNALARIGQANCLLDLDKAAEAKAVFLEISERTPSQEKGVLAAAFNGLGECWYREKKWEEARRCFLRTVTLYSEGVAGEQVARALYFAGDCFFQLQDTEDWKDRARRELSECMRRFPNTPWADRARRMLPNIPK